MCFIVKNHYAIEYMSSWDLISYTHHKLYTNRFNLCRVKPSFSEHISVCYMNIMWCRECKLYYSEKANKV